MSSAECVHLATHVSWKLSAVVLSPGEVLDSQPSKPGSGRFFPSGQSTGSEGSQEACDEESSELSSTLELPHMSEFLLTAADLLSLRLTARLVVVSSCHTRDQHGWASADGVLGLTRALLAAGAQCVLVSLWPVPDTATKILLRAFYSALLQGSRVSKALAEAMQTVQHTKHFGHPANWAGFVLVGADVRLSNKVALMGQALCELLKTPEKCRDALRVTLHLVEKSLQRIHRGQKNAMYTTQKSIENKVGSVNGWKDLLMSVGFRFEPAANGIPSSVFFPQSDPEERLTQCSASLQALLGLTGTSLSALSKLMSNVEVADDIISVVRQVIGQFSMKNIEAESIEVPIGVKLWQVPGCHELLASLGFDLMEVGADEVTLRTGKLANRRNIQFVLQALLALFDTQEAPKNLSVDSSSSLESLNSLDAGGEDDLLEGSSPTNVSGGVPDALLPHAPPVPARPRPLPPPGHRSTVTAFTSYVRRRGEPDGRTANAGENAASSVTSVAAISKPLISSASSSSSNSRLLIGRPGGGGESDAAFTPSPPVADLSACVATLTLAHQNRIRTLYSNNNDGSSPIGDGTGSSTLPLAVAYHHRRPDSSSSASSATDWEGNGHSTVLRRVGNVAVNHPLPPLPPLPTTRQPPPPPPPMVDPLHPLTPLMYNSALGFDSPSSDSEFGSNAHTKAHSTPKSSYRGLRSRQSSNAIAQGNQSSLPDRLSVSTDLGKNIESRKPMLSLAPDDDVVIPSEASALFFQSQVKEQPDGQKKSCVPSADPSRPGAGMQDQKMASQLRHLSRELTPTISDVYHERNLGLGLAPPLSQLLTARNLQESLRETDDGLDKLGLITSTISEENSSCSSKTTEGSTKTKPWLSSAALQRFYHTEGSELLNGDRESKARSNGSPCSELSRRDEGDGRSIADSQCSAGSYKKTCNMNSIPHRPKGSSGCFYTQDKEEAKEECARPIVPVSVADQGMQQGPSIPVVPMPRMRSSKHHPPPPPPPIPNGRKAFPGGFIPMSQQTSSAPSKC